MGKHTTENYQHRFLFWRKDLLDHIRNFLKGAILFTIQIQIMHFDSCRLIRCLACRSVWNNSVPVIVVKFYNANFYYNLLRRLEFYCNRPKQTYTLQEHLPNLCSWSVAVIGLRNWKSLHLLKYTVRPKTEIYNWDRFSSLRYWSWGRRNSFIPLSLFYLIIPFYYFSLSLLSSFLSSLHTQWR